MLAKAAAQASLGAGCCGAAQGSELLETQCVLAAGGTPHGSTEAAGWAPVGRQGRAHRCPQKVLGSWGEKGKDTVGHVCRVRRGGPPKGAVPQWQSCTELKPRADSHWDLPPGRALDGAWLGRGKRTEHTRALQRAPQAKLKPAPAHRLPPHAAVSLSCIRGHRMVSAFDRRMANTGGRSIKSGNNTSTCVLTSQLKQ